MQGDISFIFIAAPPSLDKPEGSVIIIVLDFVEENQFLFVVCAGKEQDVYKRQLFELLLEFFFSLGGGGYLAGVGAVVDHVLHPVDFGLIEDVYKRQD